MGKEDDAIQTVDKRTERQLGKIRRALRDGHIAVGGISEATGIERQKVFNLLAELVASGEVVKTNGSAYNEYRLAEPAEPESVEDQKPSPRDQILASLAYSTQVDLNAVYVEGVERVRHLDVRYAREMGYQIKLLAVVNAIATNFRH